MSDPFAPSPLPPRPVYQEADIVERGAAAEDRNLQLRYQEFAETGRRKMQRDRAQAKAQYGADVQTAQMDYQDRLNNPLNNLISSLPQIALGIYESVRDARRDEYLVQENGRQASMLFASRAKVNDGIRAIMSEMQIEGLSFEEVRESIVEVITSETEGMKWSGDAEIDQQNQLQWQNISYQAMESALNRAQAIDTHNSLAETDRNMRAGLSKLLEEYRRGDDSKLVELQEWLSTNPRGLEDEHKLGSYTQNLINDAMVDRLAAVGEQTYIDARDQGVGIARARLLAQQAMQEDQIYDQLEARESGSRLRDQAMDSLDDRVAIENGLKLDEDKEGRSAWFIADVAGEHENLSGSELQASALASGFSDAEAFNIGILKNKADGDKVQLQHNVVAQSKRDRDAALQSAYEVAFLHDLTTTTVLPTKKEFTNTIAQTMGNASLEMSKDDLQWWQDQYDAVEKGLWDRYQPERSYIDGLMAAVKERATMMGDVAFLKTTDGQLVSVDQIHAQLSMGLSDAITRGVEGVGPDGEPVMQRFTSTTPLGDEEAGGMMNYLQVSARKVLSGFQLRGTVGQLLGLSPLPTALQRGTGGKDRIASDPAAATVGPSQVAVYATSRSIVEQLGNQELLDRFDRSSATQQTSMALSAIPLQLYTPGQTVEEAGDTLSHNMSVLSEYRTAGLINQAQVDPTTGGIAVQLVPNGSWLPIIRESQTIKMRLAELTSSFTKVSEIVAAENDDLILIDGSFMDIEEPNGSGRSITVPTQHTRAVGDALSKAAATLAENVPYLWSFLNEWSSDPEVLQRAVQGAVPYGVQR